MIGPVLGGLAVLSFGGLVGRLAGRQWAPAGALVLALTLPQLYTSRDAFSETAVQVLLFGGLSLVIDALTSGRPAAAATQPVSLTRPVSPEQGRRGSARRGRARGADAGHRRIRADCARDGGRDRARSAGEPAQRAGEPQRAATSRPEPAAGRRNQRAANPSGPSQAAGASADSADSAIPPGRRRIGPAGGGWRTARAADVVAADGQLARAARPGGDVRDPGDDARRAGRSRDRTDQPAEPRLAGVPGPGDRRRWRAAGGEAGGRACVLDRIVRGRRLRHRRRVTCSRSRRPGPRRSRSGWPGWTPAASSCSRSRCCC